MAGSTDKTLADAVKAEAVAYEAYAQAAAKADIARAAAPEPAEAPAE